MCGICGLLSLNGREPVDRGALEAMNATLIHRGPDDEGAVLHGPMGLAARRLSIIDLESGNQPIANEDGSVTVVQNGEIYNYRELRERLLRRGHRFKTSCDTEVMVHLYEEQGPAFVRELRGMFALALWDRTQRKLLLARDRFGIKPLYYCKLDDSFGFASELKALMQHDAFSREIDLDGLSAYLALGCVPAPLTIFRQGRKLPAGHMMILQEGRMKLERFARPQPARRGELRRENLSELASELRERLRESVRAHLIADVPVGVLLSGGVDSSVITALAASESREPLRTFSIGFEEEGYNELWKARLVARRYGTEHHELVVRPNAVDLLPKIVDVFDEPFGDSSALPTYLVSELAAKEVKVVLAGEGGDELFGGYFTYVADQLAPIFGPPASLLRPLIDRLPSSSSAVRLDYKAKRFAHGATLPPLERHCSWMELFSADARAELLFSEQGVRSDPFEGHRARYAETSGAESLTRLQDVDLGTYLVDDLLVKADRSSMAHSLETRVPYLDTSVSDLALSTPVRHKVRGLAKKRVLRAAAAGLVPREVLRARKQGFAIPAAGWLRGELAPFARQVLSPDNLRGQGFFRPEPVARLLDEHVAGRVDHSRQVWLLMMFTLWYEQSGRGKRQLRARSPLRLR